MSICILNGRYIFSVRFFRLPSKIIIWLIFPAWKHHHTFTASCTLTMLVLTRKPTRDFDPMLAWCWANVADAGPTSNQHAIKVRWVLELWFRIRKVKGRHNAMTCAVFNKSTVIVCKWHTVRWRVLPRTSVQGWPNIVLTVWRFVHTTATIIR